MLDDEKAKKKTQIQGFTSETETDRDETNETDETKNKTNETERHIRELKVVNSLKQNPNLTQKELAKKTGIPLGTLKRIYSDLQKKGVLVRHGNSRSGVWKVNESIVP